MRPPNSPALWWYRAALAGALALGGVAFTSCGGGVEPAFTESALGDAGDAAASSAGESGVDADVLGPSERACGTSCPTVMATTAYPQRLVVDDAGVTWGGYEVATYYFDGGVIQVTDKPQLVNGLAVNATTVFFGGSDGALFGCPRSGCTPPPPPAPPDWSATPLALGIGLGDLAIDSTTIYFNDVNTGKIYSCPLNGCPDPPLAIRSGIRRPAGLSLFGTRLYWVECDEGGSVNWCDDRDCASTTAVLANGLKNPYSVVADDSGVYWSEIGTTADRLKPEGRVVHLASNGTATVLAVGVWASALALDASHVYWPNADGWIVKCAKSGCAGNPTRIARGLSRLEPPMGIGVDNTNVYWTEYDSPGAVVKAPK